MLVKWGLDFADEMGFRQVHSSNDTYFILTDRYLSRPSSSLQSVEEQCMRNVAFK